MTQTNMKTKKVRKIRAVAMPDTCVGTSLLPNPIKFTSHPSGPVEFRKSVKFSISIQPPHNTKGAHINLLDNNTLLVKLPLKPNKKAKLKKSKEEKEKEEEEEEKGKGKGGGVGGKAEFEMNNFLYPVHTMIVKYRDKTNRRTWIAQLTQKVNGAPLRAVDASNDQRKKIEANLRKRIPDVKIVFFYLFHNDALQARYNGIKTEFKLRLGEKKINEKFLWHGTSAENADKILRSGFHPGFCTRFKYGTGVYFAKNPAKAKHYAPLDSKNSRRLLYCRVCVGEAHLGKENHQTPEPKPGGGEYDSRVDNLSNPQIFVTCREQALPVALIVFRD